MLPSWWRRRFLAVEFLLAALISLASQLIFLDRSPLESILEENRGAIYRTFASITGAAALFIVVGQARPRAIAPLRRS